MHNHISSKPWELNIIEGDGTLVFQTKESEVSLSGWNKDNINHSAISRLWHWFCLANGFEHKVVLNDKVYFIKTNSLRDVLSSKQYEKTPVVLALKKSLGSSLASLFPSLYLRELLNDFKLFFDESLKKHLLPIDFAQQFINKCETLGEAIEKVQPRAYQYFDKMIDTIQGFEHRSTQQQKIRALIAMQRLAGIPNEDTARKELEILKNGSISQQKEFFKFLISHAPLANDYGAFIEEFDIANHERSKEIIKILFEEIDNATILGGVKKREEEKSIIILKKCLEDKKDEILKGQEQSGVQNEFLSNCMQLAVAGIVEAIQSFHRMDFVDAINERINIEKFNLLLAPTFKDIIPDEEERSSIISSLLQPLQKEYSDILYSLVDGEQRDFDSEYSTFIINSFYDVMNELQQEISYLKGELHEECNKFVQAVQDAFDLAVEKHGALDSKQIREKRG